MKMMTMILTTVKIGIFSLLIPTVFSFSHVMAQRQPGGQSLEPNSSSGAGAALASVFAMPSGQKEPLDIPKSRLPDLTIRQYRFVPSNDKGLRIQVANYGRKASKPCRLQLTVRKINGTPAGRTMYQTIPAIRPRGSVWINLNTTKILPKNVRLRDTTFKLIADAGKYVAESNEDNNETWHNLK